MDNCVDDMLELLVAIEDEIDANDYFEDACLECGAPEPVFCACRLPWTPVSDPTR